MTFITDKDGYVYSYALCGEIVGGTEMDPPADISHFEENYTCYHLCNGALTFDQLKFAANQTAEQAGKIRMRREAECFSVINRGKLWYDTLTAEQVEELNRWYLAWLDAPQTGAVPDKPIFLERGGIEMCKLK